MMLNSSSHEEPMLAQDLAMLLAMMLVSLNLIVFVLPFPLQILGIVVFLVAYFVELHKAGMKYRVAMISVVVLLVFRFFGTYTVIQASKSVPPKISSPDDYMKKYFPLSLGGIWDIGKADKFVRRKRSLIFRSSPDDIDPFTGRGYLVRYGSHYSVGPDLEDNVLTIVYDPTNGTFSAGDIPLRE